MFVVRDTNHPQEDLNRNWSAPLGGHSNELSGMTFSSEEDAKEAFLRVFDKESTFEYRFHPAYNSFSEVHYEGLGAFQLEAETLEDAIIEASKMNDGLAFTMEAGNGKFFAEDVISFHQVSEGRFVFEIKD
jgi:hypothetical protein